MPNPSPLVSRAAGSLGAVLSGFAARTPDTPFLLFARAQASASDERFEDDGE